MNRIITNILTFALLIFASAAFATDVSHYIPTKVGDGSIALSSKNKVGRSDDGIVYTCYGKAEFSVVPYTATFCIHLPKAAGDSIIISPPLDKLAQLTITPNSRKAGDEDFKVAISTDGTNWTDSTVTMNYANGSSVFATIPVRGANYIKITTLKERDIISLIYTYLDCNCFTATP